MARESRSNDVGGDWQATLQNGATFAPGKVGQAFHFDGADDSVDLGNGFDLQTFTLAMWVKAGAVQQTYADIIDNNHTDGRGWVVQYQNTGLLFEWGVALIGSIRFNLVPDQWQFLAITLDPATDSRVYLDGALIGSFPTGRPVTYDGSQFLRLSAWGGGGRHFNGSIDEFDIYDRALTGAEIQALHAAGSAGKCRSCAPRPNGLAAWWPAEVDGTAIELAAGNHGTLGSSVSFTSGQVGQAFLFVDNVNSFVTLPPSASWMPTNNQLTLECWIKPDFTVAGDKLDTIISKRDGCGGFSYHFGLYKGHQGKVGPLYFGSSAGVADSTSNVPNDGQFHHVAVTFDGNKPSANIQFYIDGEPAGVFDSPQQLPATAEAPVLGRHASCGYYSSAVMDEISLYHRELAASEIQAIFNAEAAGKCSRLTEGADLAASSVTGPMNAQPGETVFVTYAISNLSLIAAKAPWREDILLSQDAIIGGDTALSSVVHLNDLPPGAGLIRTQAVTIPTINAAGALRFVVRVDAANALAEENESNNAAISADAVNVPVRLSLRFTDTDIAENAQPPELVGQIIRNGRQDSPLTVMLESSDATELTVPASVIIPAGQASVTFAATVQRDNVVDDHQPVTLMASAPGYESAAAQALVLNTDQPRLALELTTPSVSEGASLGMSLRRIGPINQALTVNLSASSAANLVVPASVTIPAGTNVSMFLVFASADGVLEPPRSYTVSATAPGFERASTDVLVLDADQPALTLSLNRTNVTEADGPTAAMARLTRSGSAASFARGLVVGLSSSSIKAALPPRVTFPPNSTNLVFPVGVVDDDLVNAPVIAALSAVGLSGSDPLGTPAMATLFIADNDGPTLTLTLDRSIAAEGLTIAATVSRNTSTENTLRIVLNSSDTSEATVPVEVIILAGASNATFEVSTVADGAPDGSQAVTLTASTPGFTSGSALLLVTDINLPDLAVAEASGPAVVFTGQPVPLSFRIENRGLAVLTNAVRQRVFLSRDPFVGEDTIAGEQLLNPAPGGGLAPGQSFSGTITYIPPNNFAGQFWVVVTTDASKTANELDEDNNAGVSAAPIQINPSYSATASAEPSLAPAGTPIRLRGAVTSANGSSVEGRSVSLHLSVRGVQRMLTALAAADGAFETLFTPLPGEAGHYSIHATHPGQSPPASVANWQDDFTLLGARFEPAVLAINLVEGSAGSASAGLVNLSEMPLDGLSVSLVNLPAGVSGSAVIDPMLPGSGTNTLTLNLTASTPGFVEAAARVTSGEGVTVELPLRIFVAALEPNLVGPPELFTGVLRGGQRAVQFEVRNEGGAPTGPLNVLLPASLKWISVASTNPLPSLPPGATNTVTLLLSPPAGLTLGEYSGSLAVNGATHGVSLPFKFRVVSESKGALLISAVDEFTYYVEGNPPVTNAAVSISDFVTDEVVTNGVTDAQGRFLVPSVMEGYYNVNVSADRHTTFRSPVLVRAAETNEVLAFLARQTVQYIWTVTPTQIEDRTRITIETVFETAVPLPVVTIEPTVIDLADMRGSETAVELKIENHGLIAAQNARLQFPLHPDWEFLPLITDLGQLGARSVLRVPMIIRKKSAGLVAADSGSGGSGPCTVSGGVSWELPCGELNNTYSANTTVVNAGENCGGTGGGGGGTSGGSCCSAGGGGGGGAGDGVGGRGGVMGYVFSNEPVINTPDVCDCGLFGSLCGEFEVSFSPNAILEQLVNKILSRLPQVQVKEAKLELNASGRVCVCCEEGSLGVSGGGSASASVTIVLVYGYSGGAEGGFSAPGFSSVSASVSALAGVEVTLSGSVEVSGSRSCDGDTELCFSGSAGVGVFAGVRINGSVSATSEDGVSFSGEVEGAAGIQGSFSASVSGCTGGDGPQFEVCGSLKLVLHLEGSLTGTVAGQQVTRSFGGNADQSIYDSGCERNGDGAAASAPFLAAAGASPAAGGPPLREPFDVSGVIRPVNDILTDLGVQPRTGGVCATVRLRLSQDLIQTRDAFNATLELINNDPEPLTEIEVVVEPVDGQGRPATNFFQIRPAIISGLGSVNGQGSLAGGARGSASWILVPTIDAAPDAPKLYAVGGKLRYRQGGQLVQVPLTPANITVHPSPRLFVRYFHQRDVFSDDPFTEEIEPAIPYSLAVMVENRGQGPANNVRIISAQPQIIENERALLIGFELIASQVEDRNIEPSLTVNFGEVPPGTNAIGRWLFTSTLQGLFTDYRASFEHIDGFGNPRLSLIEGVEIHEMTRLVRATGADADMRPDFLVNSVPDPLDLPEVVYLSDGSTAPVSVLRNATHDGPPTSARQEIQLMAPLETGYSYLRVADPQGAVGRRLWRLVAVRRSDNTSLPAENFWQTDRTFVGQGNRPIAENNLHLFDRDSTGAYTLVYEPAAAPDTNGPTSVVAALPALSFPSFAVRWSGADNVSVAAFDIFVSVDDGPFAVWLTNASPGGAIYEGESGHRYAFYSVARDAAGNREAAASSADAFTVTGATNRPPAFTDQADVVIDEGATLALTLGALDRDAGQSRVLALVQGPAGLTLDPQSGAMRWPTGEGVGPSTNHVTVSVRDNGQPALSATMSFNVIVREVNSAPLLAPVAGQLVNESQTLLVTNTATDGDLPQQALRFELGPDAPEGAIIDPDTGVLSWMPSPIQGGTTHRVVIVVRDDGMPSLSATQLLSVVVRNSSPDFTVSVGTTNVFAGESSSVPLRLSAGVPLTAAAFVLETPETLVTNLILEPLVPEVGNASLQTEGDGRFNISLRSDADNSLQGLDTIARLRFTAISNGPSAVAALKVTGVSGTLRNGETLSGGRTFGGRVFIIAQEPLLDVALADGQTRSLTLYGQPGHSYEIQVATNLDETVEWLRLTETVLPAPFLALSPMPETAPVVFYRAREIERLNAPLRIRRDDGKVIIEWPIGCNGCVLEETTAIAERSWIPSPQQPQAAGDDYRVTLPAPAGARFYRLVAP